MSERKRTAQDSQKGTEKVQNSFVSDAGKARRLGKTHADYWRSRVRRRTYSREGRICEVPGLVVRLKYLKRQAWFPLLTENRDAAATKAREIYMYLRANGWDAARRYM